MLHLLSYDILLEILIYLEEEEITTLLPLLNLPTSLWSDLIFRRYNLQIRDATSMDYLLLSVGLVNLLTNKHSRDEVLCKLLRDEESVSKEDITYWSLLPRGDTFFYHNGYYKVTENAFFPARTLAGAIVRGITIYPEKREGMHRCFDLRSKSRNSFTGDLFQFEWIDNARFILIYRISYFIRGMKERLEKGELDPVDNLLEKPYSDISSVLENIYSSVKGRFINYPYLNIYPEG